jgi:putative transposase
MKKSRFSEEQIMATVKQMETGRNTVELARQLGVSKYTLYAWRSKHAKIETNEAYRLRQLEEENRRLKNLVADLSLDREVLKAVITKNGWTT